MKIKVGRAIEEPGFYWYEDPLAEDDIYSWIKLRERLDIPVMATEFSPGGFGSHAAWILNWANLHALSVSKTGCRRDCRLCSEEILVVKATRSGLSILLIITINSKRSFLLVLNRAFSQLF